MAARELAVIGFSPLAMTTSEAATAVRRELERACREFTGRVAALGFVRARKMVWSRVHEPTADVVFLFRCGASYGAPSSSSVELRAQFGIRVLNDASPALALNGPSSDAGFGLVREGRYHLRFDARTGSTRNRCVGDLVRFLVEQGEPWFGRFLDAEALLGCADSPLQPEEAECLRAALGGGSSPDSEATSRDLLGLTARAGQGHGRASRRGGR